MSHAASRNRDDYQTLGIEHYGGGGVAVASVLFLITLLPDELVAIAIKFDSRGPIFSREERLDPRGYQFFALQLLASDDQPEEDRKAGDDQNPPRRRRRLGLSNRCDSQQSGRERPGLYRR